MSCLNSGPIISLGRNIPPAGGLRYTTNSRMEHLALNLSVDA